MRLVKQSKIPSDVVAKIEIVRKTHGFKTFDDAVVFLVEKVLSPEGTVPIPRLDFITSKGVITGGEK